MSESLLLPKQREKLEQLVASETTVVVRRWAEILLLYDQGHTTREIAQMVALSPRRVRDLRRQFRLRGMALFPEPSQIFVSEAGEGSIALADLVPDLGIGSSAGDDHRKDVRPDETKVSSKTISAEFPPLSEFVISAKSLKSPGTEPDDPMAEAGRKVLRYHFAQMLLHEEGTRLGEDIEELHDMRVATRRMRAASEVFGDFFDLRQLKIHLKGLRATGRALGRVRDLDVFMEKAQVYLDDQPFEHRQGLEPLLGAWERERELARAEMVAYLDSPKYQTFKAKFYTFLITPGMGAREVSHNPPSPQLVREIAPVLIYTRLAAVRAYDTALDSASIEQLHALRIEFKKLRYTVEFFREVLGDESKASINDIKVMQDHLGDLNDAQVATEILRDFLGQWDLQQAALPVEERTSPEPIMAYLSSRYTERHRLMLSFRDRWAHFSRPDFRQSLAAAVSVL